jgi:hypothetical protein
VQLRGAALDVPDEQDVSHDAFVARAAGLHLQGAAGHHAELSSSRRSGSKLVIVSPSLPHALDRDLERARHAQRLDARIHRAQPESPLE